MPKPDPRRAKPVPGHEAGPTPAGAPTLRAIADAAGVSIATVSLALRDNPLTSQKTRARVKAVAARMGYRPDPRVAKLMSYLQRRKLRAGDGTLAFITAFADPEVWRESATWTNYFEGATAQAAQLGYRVEHFWARRPGVSEQRLSRILHSRGIEGVLILPGPPRVHREMQLEWEHFHTMTFGHGLQQLRVHRVVHNHYHTVLTVAAELRARGYQRIGLVIAADHDQRVANLWSAGFLSFQNLDPAHAVPLFRGAVEAQSLRAWFEAHQPDAVISDELSPVKLLNAAGYRVPHDYAFVVLDWLERTRPFAGVDQHSADIGAAAAKHVISALHRDEFGLPRRPEMLMIQGTWVDGDSVPKHNGAAPATAPLTPTWLDHSVWE